MLRRLAGRIKSGAPSFALFAKGGISRLFGARLLFLQLLFLEAPLSPLSSRPERSVVERSLCGGFFLEIFFDRVCKKKHSIYLREKRLRNAA